MARKPQQSRSNTRTRILDIAERLVQRRGFNGFSYADIAAQLGITTATLHYHFAGKAELGRALIARYTGRFMDELASIDARFPDARARLEAYANLYAAILQEQRFCLCGMLAAEYETLPKPMREAVIEFFDQNEAWLIQVLGLGQKQGTVRFTGSAADAARMVMGALEGAMLVARPYGEVRRFRTAAAQLLMSLAKTTPVES
ncbi:TetR/AcrR family transcriptional regulator [Tepidiforma sp.]|uniref:TetR/AcrR family transcriptional regulator n=1 Tax=Tepidiforma sp. TaxID=2682230 RepID=UPI002ADDCB8C|nr:TetR/AcrR family transcriptional regulator [Tepidiforma sp.]